MSCNVLSHDIGHTVSSIGGIVVSIAAFQAVDPGSIPGQCMTFRREGDLRHHKGLLKMGRVFPAIVVKYVTRSPSGIMAFTKCPRHSWLLLLVWLKLWTFPQSHILHVVCLLGVFNLSGQHSSVVFIVHLLFFQGDCG